MSWLEADGESPLKTTVETAQRDEIIEEQQAAWDNTTNISNHYTNLLMCLEDLDQ